MNLSQEFQNQLLYTLIAGAAVRVAANPHEAASIGKGIITLLNIVALKDINKPEPETA